MNKEELMMRRWLNIEWGRICLNWQTLLTSNWQGNSISIEATQRFLLKQQKDFHSNPLKSVSIDKTVQDIIDRKLISIEAILEATKSGIKE